MKLPNAESAIVDIRKLRDYCLSESHPEGRHKARVFSARLGISATDSVALKAAIEEGILHSEVSAHGQTPHGSRYVVDLDLTWRGKNAIVRTAWMVRNGETVPRLVSCYVT